MVLQLYTQAIRLVKKGHGVGFILNRATAKSLFAFNPVSDGSISVRLQAKPVSLTLIWVYAPTPTADEEACECFYEQVQQAIEIAPKRDMLFVTGEWNTKFGQSVVKTRLVNDDYILTTPVLLVTS